MPKNRDVPEDVDPETGEYDGPVIRPFADWLREQRRGLTHDELTDGLHDLIAAVNHSGKAGTLTLQIKIAPFKKNAQVLEVTDVVKTSLPTPDREAAIYFTDRDGNLSRDNPHQLPGMERLREVPAIEIRDTPKENHA
jgi:hypothetical protein